MKSLLFTLLLISTSGAVFAQNPLIGKWVSDRDKSLKHIKENKEFYPTAKESMLDFIKETNIYLEFTDNTITYTDGKEKSVSKYKFIESKNNIVKIIENDPNIGVPVTRNIKVKDNNLHYPVGILSLHVIFTKYK